MKDGWNTISNFEIVEDPTLEPIYSIPSLECHPGYLYSLHYANMLQEQVTKNSCIQWTEEKNKENIDTKIPILAGIDDKLFYSTIPSIPVFFNLNQ